MKLIDLIFLVSLGGVLCVYLLYPFILWVTRLLRFPERKTDAESIPRVSIIVPTYNEELVIGTKLQSLLDKSHSQDYEIIVVDSGSKDDTCNIVRMFTDEGVTLLRQEKRLGKASAINLALDVADGEVIVLTDANSRFEPGKLVEFVRNFDKDTGAVLPRLIPAGNVKLWDRIYYEVHHVFKALESNCDSVFFVFGELFAFRKALIDRIDENTASDDLEIAIRIRRKGFKIKYVPKVQVFEKIPDKLRETKVQRVRRAFGVLQVMKKNLDMLLNPKFGLYGLVIFPAHFLRLTVVPFLVLLLTGASLVEIATLFFLLFNQMFFVAIILAVGLCTLIMFSDKFRQVIRGFANLLLTQLYIISALVDLSRGKSYKIWEKVESTRVES